MSYYVCEHSQRCGYKGVAVAAPCHPLLGKGGWTCPVSGATVPCVRVGHSKIKCEDCEHDFKANDKQFVESCNLFSGQVRHYGKHILQENDRGLKIVPVLQIKVTENDNSIVFHKSDVEMMLEKFEEWNDADYQTV